MPPRTRDPRQAGLSMLELLLSLALLVIVFGKAYFLMNAATESSAKTATDVELEDQARRILRRIGFAIMGANRESLVPDVPVPLSSESVRYQVQLGISEGEVVWSDPERIAMEEADTHVYWSRNPDTANERRVTWTNLVAPYLEGELPNGMDDNGNGLIDEQGLSFVIEGDSITIRMTLERMLENGESVVKTVQTTVTCRNLPEPSS